MVNELRELMQEATARPPRESGDLATVLRTGRRRVRVRRAGVVGGTALAAGAITVSSLSWFNPAPADLSAAGVPRAAGPVIGLADARPAVEGQDYRELASHTNEDLDAANGQYFDGVTDDGLILFRDGPRGVDNTTRYALLDPVTNEKDWLPAATGWDDVQLHALALGEDRLVLTSFGEPAVLVFDRGTRAWSTVRWPGLPKASMVTAIGPDGRLYLAVPATQASPPPGGWPMGPDGEADDADAAADTFDLWSASPTDPQDVRDEGVRMEQVALTDDALVWTDSPDGNHELVHVRDLATGEETSFDPELGERCNVLGLSAAGDHIAMSQYCGTYDDGVRDDRVQVVTADGDPVVTVQDSGVDAGQLVAGGDFLSLTAYSRATGGTYVYDFEDGRLVRLGEGMSSWTTAVGPTPGDQLMWTTPAGGKVELFGRSGATAHLGELVR